MADMIYLGRGIIALELYHRGIESPRWSHALIGGHRAGWYGQHGTRGGPNYKTRSAPDVSGVSVTAKGGGAFSGSHNNQAGIEAARVRHRLLAGVSGAHERSRSSGRQGEVVYCRRRPALRAEEREKVLHFRV